jgi:hypothetical protein
LLTALTETLAVLAKAADARMTRTEQSLEQLIRAITAGHGNGKS